MLTTIFFYIKNLFSDVSINHSFIDLFSPLYRSLTKHNVDSFFLTKKHNALFPYPVISISEYTTSEKTFLKDKNLSNFLFQHVPNKEDVLFISDCAEFLTALKDLNYYTIGYSSSDLFLPSSYVFERFENLDYTYFLHIWKRYRKEPITILTTRHLIVRELKSADFPSLYSLYKDKENTIYLNTEQDYSIFYKKMSAYIENIYPFYGFGLWGVFLKETGELIGQFGIQQRVIGGRDEIELGYLLHHDYQHRGYAKEAIRAIFRYAKKHLECNRIVAKIHKQNKSSLATAISCGMQFERELPAPENDFFLYVIYVQTDCFSCAQKKQRENASKQVYNIFQKNPDTCVYGKRYQHNNQKSIK